MTSKSEEDYRPASDWGHSEDTRQRKRRAYRHWGPQDGLRWASAFQDGTPIIHIAAADEVDPNLVSLWLHRLGVQIYQGQRPQRPQPPLQIPNRLLEHAKEGHSKILDLVQRRVWGIDGTQRSTATAQFLPIHRLARQGRRSQGSSKDNRSTQNYNSHVERGNQSAISRESCEFGVRNVGVAWLETPSIANLIGR